MTTVLKSIVLVLKTEYNTINPYPWVILSQSRYVNN